MTIDGTPLKTLQMGVLTEGKDVAIKSETAARLMLLGGEPLDGPRTIWWNLVASDQALIDRAKTDWTSAPHQNWRGRFNLPPDENEHIPLAED